MPSNHTWRLHISFPLEKKKKTAYHGFSWRIACDEHELNLMLAVGFCQVSPGKRSNSVADLECCAFMRGAICHALAWLL